MAIPEHGYFGGHRATFNDVYFAIKQTYLVISWKSYGSI